MKKLTVEQKEYIQIALEMVMNLNNEGKQIWLEFVPHVSRVEIKYFADKEDLVLKDFDFEKLNTICSYIFSIRCNIYNRY